MEKLEGKVVLITGGSAGIGLAIAEEVLAEGGQVVITGRGQAALDKAREQLGGSVMTFAGDAGDREATRQCVDLAVSRFGRIDVLVNNAALERPSGPTITAKLGDFEDTYALNVFAPLFWSQEVWRASMEEHGGVIINMSSLGGTHLYPNMGAYLSSKAALNHLTRILAAELGPGVRVNAIAPGLIKTEMSKSAWSKVETRFAAALPLQRLGEPIDVARAAIFLMSEDSAWITGDVLLIDGGTVVQWGRAHKK